MNINLWGLFFEHGDGTWQGYGMLGVFDSGQRGSTLENYTIKPIEINKLYC